MDGTETITAGETGTDTSEQSRERRGDRRAGASRFHFPERRTGFDRRERYAITGFLRDRPHMLALVLIAINVLSALDFALTYRQLEAGVAVEGNPVLAELFAQGPGRAWAFKTVLVLAVTVAMWLSRKHRAVLGLAVGALVLYSLLIAYHLVGMKAVGLI